MSYERQPAGEEHDIRKIVRLTEEMLKLDRTQIRRGQHAKATGIARARLKVADEVPSSARHGVFATPGHEFEALVRFSNGVGRVQSDALKDARGMAIKLLKVDGKSKVQDFVMINFPTFPFRSVREYANFTELRRTWNGRLGAELGDQVAGLLHFLPWHFKQFWQTARKLSRAPSHVLAEQYWSMSTYCLGEDPIKFTAIPSSETKEFATEPKNASGPNALAESLAAYLLERVACFDLCIQFFQNEISTPVEDPSVLWLPEPMKIATLTIDRCDMATDELRQLREEVDRLSFSPWNCLPEHRPLGGINRVRKAVYRMNADLRTRERNFQGLIQRERAFIADARRVACEQADAATDDAQVSRSPSLDSTKGSGPEPWLSFAQDDHVGLAFSGGGIRSATFNLGLLQGLNDLNLLPRFDYLATVSGGGYIGAWWTAWRARQKAADRDSFPSTKDEQTDGARTPEPYAVRHLRRFSNYLVPRFGVLEVEFWNGAMAVLSGLIPALTVASSIILLSIWMWLILGWGLLGRGVHTSAILLGGISALVLILGELWWQRTTPRTTDDRSGWPRMAYPVFSSTAVALVTIVCLLIDAHATWLPNSAITDTPVSFFQTLPLKGAAAIVALFLPAIIFSIVIGLLVFLRFLRIVGESSSDRTHIADLALRRVLGRLAFMALMWSIPAMLWWLAETIRSSVSLTLATGGVGGLSAMLFAWLRTWIVRALQPGRQLGFAKKLRALLPQLLAYIALFSASILLCMLLQLSFENPVALALSYTVPIVAIACAWLWFDPVNCGMHAFYRDRLSRAYLGASNLEIDRELNEQLTDVDSHDDVYLTDIGHADIRRLPLHLVCCAANELDADPLSNFSRGARSAVVSPLGLTIGDAWSNTDLSLGSAITASAAAFNSNMGSVSKQLGNAVTFLMCALNLRLGLWVPRPGFAKPLSWLKGWPYFYEMFGATSRSMVHLSDGGHFENLALYELVRRHCRYIVLSDVGADPDVAFDDLGNAVRRIREDFGVDIEIDVTPLKPGVDGRTKQHMAVGTIHYDHANSDGRLDKGILLYFKPGLTGDEPMDVQQYRSRNADFPNETTVDQFYDEAQWEAYRRLGQHAAHAALGFIEGLPGSATGSPRSDDVFVAARWKWYPTPPEISAKMLEVTSRYIAIEAELRDSAPQRFVQELYPELAGAFPNTPWPVGSMMKAIHYLTQMLQIMEDTYLACQLEQHWNHPLNSGWMNGFRRWASAPIFRSWWPILKGMFNDDFRDFVENRLDVTGQAQFGVSGTFAQWANVPNGLAKEYAQASKIFDDPGLYWTGDYSLCSADGTAHKVQVGLLRVQGLAATWQWTFSDLFVLPQLGATGTVTLFLQELIADIRRLPTNRPTTLKVVNPAFQVRRLNASAAGTGLRAATSSVLTQAQRADWNDQVALYKRLGFNEQPDGSLVLRV